MANDNKEIKELDQSEIENAAGGLFGVCICHDLRTLTTVISRGDTYRFAKCSDCGKEFYYKNNEEICPSEYYRSCFGVE